MVAAPKIGSKKARSERHEDKTQVAGVGLNEIFSHPSRISVQNDGKWIAAEDETCTRLSSFQPVEEQTSNYMSDKMIGTSSSEIQTSHVKLKEQTWRKSKEFVAFVFLFKVAWTSIIYNSARFLFLLLRKK